MKFYRAFWKKPVVYTLHLAPIPHDFIHCVFTYVGDMAIGVSTEVSEFLYKKLSVSKIKICTILNAYNTIGIIWGFERYLRDKF